jgi:RNA polymerase primary sigma factor
MIANLAVSVRKLRPVRSGAPGGPLSRASQASEDQAKCQLEPGAASATAGAPRPDEARPVRKRGAARARETAHVAIRFVDHPSFADPTCTAEIMAPMPSSESKSQARGAAVALELVLSSADDYRDSAFLTREQESHLFRKLNFLKYRAAQLREWNDHKADAHAAGHQVAELLREVSAIKDRIVRSYFGLVVSIAKSWVQPGEDLFELVSVGNLAMVRALERFDFARGRRFSTYATWAITNDLVRRVPRERIRRRRFVTGREQVLQLAVDHRSARCDADEREQRRDLAQVMLRRLTEREQTILSRRFGLTGEPETLQQLGRALGISKERVRQIELRALGKLRGIVALQNLDGVVSGSGRRLPVRTRRH